jgi:hypothetical protein
MLHFHETHVPVKFPLLVRRCALKHQSVDMFVPSPRGRGDVKLDELVDELAHLQTAGQQILTWKQNGVQSERGE